MKNKLLKTIRRSPINYMSDLFIVSMVLSWIWVIAIECIFAIYSTIILNDTSMWHDVTTLVSVPLTTGGGIWMVKNSVQHAIANSKGKIVEKDFPEIKEE